MGKIIIDSTVLEGIAAKISSLTGQGYGIASILNYEKDIDNALGMTYILVDYSHTLTNKLYDLLENAQDLGELNKNS